MGLVGIIEWLGIPAAFAAWSFALYLYRVSPPSLSSRLLIAMLLVDGIAVISSYNNPLYVDKLIPLGIEVWWRIHVASDWAVIATYLAFIGVTVASPLAKPFGTRQARYLLALTAALLTAAIMPLDMATFLDRFATLLYTLIALVLTWGFLAALHAWLTASDEASRSRAKAFAIAFGFRDSIWLFTFVGLVAYLNNYIEADSVIITLLMPTFYAAAVAVYVPLVAYGMLRTQLFDIDLRVKRTLKRSTVLAAFVAFFFLVSGLAEIYLSNMLGSILGLIMTAALMFFLDPLQRAAQTLADAAMPGTVNTPEYKSFRKLQVYEATVNATMVAGSIPAHQRGTLNALIGSLEIDPKAAEQIELDAIEMFAKGDPQSA